MGKTLFIETMIIIVDRIRDGVNLSAIFILYSLRRALPIIVYPYPEILQCLQ